MKLLPVAFAAAATCLVVMTSPVEAQNAAVHAATVGESRAANPAPAPNPAAGAKPPAQSTDGATPAAQPKPAPAAPSPAKPTPGAATSTTPVGGAGVKSPPATGGTKPTGPTPSSPAAGATTPAKAPAAATPPAVPALAPVAATKPLAADKTWVQNFKAKPNDKACYRRTAFASKTKECPVGYNFDDALVCSAQCPIEYPVQCGMECLPQNKDCTLSVLGKVSAVASAAVTAATGGFFGGLTKVAEGLTRGVGCVQQVYDVTSRIYEFIDEAQTLGQATTAEKANTAVQQSDLFTIDMVVAVATCLGQVLPKAVDQTKKLLTVAKPIVTGIVEKKFTKENLKDKLKFLEWFKKVNTTDPAAPKTTTQSAT